MLTIVLIIAGLLIGGVVGYLIGKQETPSNRSSSGKGKIVYQSEDEAQKQVNLNKIREHLSAQANGKLDNKTIREILVVSDTTACRYLNDLEKEGLIKQIGTDGPGVYYQKV